MQAIQLQSASCLYDLADYPENFSPCYRRVLSARGIHSSNLDKTLARLPNVSLLKSAKESAAYIFDSIKRRQKILIVGDYDADGACSSALLATVFKLLNVNFEMFIPCRKKMGYGLSKKAIDIILQKKPNIVITVDNGISAIAEIDLLKRAGIGVVVTDHHLPKTKLPNANFIVNPNQESCFFPSKNLAGVGVIFYWVLALRQIYKENNEVMALNPVDLLPLVAIGTVADVVKIDEVNRILIANGLKRMRAQYVSSGIKSLCELSAINLSKINTQDISFKLAPRLNAAGRIADMLLSVDCLMENNFHLANDYAQELERLNQERKLIENQVLTEIENELAMTAKKDDSVICLYDSNWSEGVIGICAAKIASQFHKPTFVFTLSDDRAELKASARSPIDYDLSKLLDKVNYFNPEVIKKYGGHQQAAGVTIGIDDFEMFSAIINKIHCDEMQKLTINKKIIHDGQLLPYEMSLENAEFLNGVEPWGHQYNPPIFCNTFYVDKIFRVGGAGQFAKLLLTEKESETHYQAVCFQQDQRLFGLQNKWCDIVFKLSVNEWNNNKQLLLVVEYATEK